MFKAKRKKHRILNYNWFIGSHVSMAGKCPLYTRGEQIIIYIIGMHEKIILPDDYWEVNIEFSKEDEG